jgi:hypothetical protein
MQEENKERSRLVKAGFICINNLTNEVICRNGKPIAFKTKEEAELYIKENNISASIK